jgi:Uma2 family endonuclease
MAFYIFNTESCTSMNAALQYLPHYTYDDYVHWEGRWELLDGHPIAMSPMPIPKHQWVTASLRAEFTFALKKKGCKHCRAYDPVDYKVAEDTILQPDMLIVCGEIKKKFLDFPPVLVAEVFSPSTVLRDKNTKFDKYQQEGIRYYLMVDIDKQAFELYEISEGKYVLVEHNFSEPFTFLLDEGCIIDVTLSTIWD